MKGQVLVADREGGTLKLVTHCGLAPPCEFVLVGCELKVINVLMCPQVAVLCWSRGLVLVDIDGQEQAVA